MKMSRRREGRFEVQTRAMDPARVPLGFCCACGHRGRVGEDWRAAETLKLPLFQPRTVTLPEYHFPLCRACARAKAARDRYLYGGAILAFVAVLAIGVFGWMRTPPAARGWEPALQTLLLTAFAAAAGTGAGWVAAQASAVFRPHLRRGNRVAGAVDYEFEGYRAGAMPHEQRCFFRFTSETYARAFAAANAPDPFASPEATSALDEG
jgi:hypothetical protein